MTEILDCGRTVAGDVVALHIGWDGDLSRGTVTWAMEISGADGADKVSLGLTGTGGSVSEQFVDDARSGRRQRVEPDADLGEQEVTARFPANVVGVAVEWPVWRAVITVDDVTIAEQVASA